MALIQLQVIMMDPGWIPLTANIRGICRTLTVKSTKGDYDCPVTAFRGEVVQLGLQVKVQMGAWFCAQEISHTGNNPSSKVLN